MNRSLTHLFFALATLALLPACCCKKQNTVAPVTKAQTEQVVFEEEAINLGGKEEYNV